MHRNVLSCFLSATILNTIPNKFLKWILAELQLNENRSKSTAIGLSATFKILFSLIVDVILYCGVLSL